MSETLIVKYGYSKICTKCHKDLPLTSFKWANKKINQLRGDCSVCRKIVSDKWYAVNKLARVVTVKKWQKENKNKVYLNNKTWRMNNKDKSQKYDRKWRLNNPDKVRQKGVFRKRAAPKWLTDDMKEEINIIYKAAAYLERTTGIKYHIDHIIPLKGDTIRGLHVPWNLQILTATENLSKGNSLQGVGY